MGWAPDLRSSAIGFDRYPDTGITGWQSTEVQLVNIDVPVSSTPGGNDPFGGLLVNPRLRNPFGGPQMNVPQRQTVEAVCSRIQLYQNAQPSSKNCKKAMIVSCIDQQMDPKFIVVCEGTISFDPKSGFAKNLQSGASLKVDWVGFQAAAASPFSMDT